ncbi:hypothetical protein A2774_04350 [Candidatus Roizmanbacteria bacterium RIFCSPHIGHO2_01_FULL_39_12c]|uniref:Glycosyltransferase RgtA/B/C/D-like domain-containing protein n=1 Tax=Candidatus Roizmanbacteria bacterium RIFCSPHIGHO2_01_FULL_39_12c TaxID=1802031 RepID=A0A1F7G9B4_9BACT|nr:MAG: hypothetical protein A2774_04350 [Candidatus Roizmanbacteria bacterium RIFCSPHIGHO2_01_FULL_39_12c]OGK47799.1 MAG: hypothetical protein A2963_03020 [Candidatus Roizmanbacteria bacterium RIFCSPLOWO2_01_FULL_40_13]
MKNSSFKFQIKSHLPLIIFLLFYFFIIGYKLIVFSAPFFDWDESINVQVSKEVIENKSLVPLWQGEPWLDKPPLPFWIFGLVMKLTSFIRPEISLRIFSLILSIIALIFVYSNYLKAFTVTEAVEKQSGIPVSVYNLLASLTVIITAFTPIFLQRSQIVNLDVFLLIGWLGYLLFVQNFWLSFVFLTISVLTKSLIGFYPAFILLAYNLIILWGAIRFKFRKPKRLEKPTLSRLGEPLRLIRMAMIQIAFLSIWYIIMLFSFRKNFWQQHIIETHFMRVTTSIESHFGQRTYYIDLMREQLGVFFWPSLVGLAIVILSAAKNLSIYLRKNRIRDRSLTMDQVAKLLYSSFLLPWFIFLNLTKTKIFWYLYPAIPQFAFLAVYPFYHLSFPRQTALTGKRESSLFSHPEHVSRSGFRNKSGMTIILIMLIISYLFYTNFLKTNFFTTFYSKPEDYYDLALFAKEKCDSLSVLVGRDTREATKTLESMKLTITSTRQWGDHPSIVYYFGKKVNFIYQTPVENLKKNECLAVKSDDSQLINNNSNEIKKFNSFSLYKR